MDSMTKIRIAQPTDDDIVIRLLIESFSYLYMTMGVEMSPEREAYLSNQAGRRMFATSFICEVDGKAAGTITVVPPCAQSEAWLTDAWALRLLAVAPGMQGRGIARALIEVAEGHARAAGAATMCLHARRGITNQARLYSRLDYIRDPVGDIDGQPFQEGYRKPLRAGNL